MADEKAEGGQEAAAPKMGKSNMVLIVIISVLATIVVGGGVGAFFMMKGSNSAEEKTAEAEEPAADAPADEKTDGKKKDKGKKDTGPKGPAIYVGMEPPFVVNFDETQSARFLQVTVQVMTRDQATSQMIRDNDPMLRNDLLMLFGGQQANDLGTREGKDNLRKQALETIRGVIKTEGGKPDLVEAVYFTTFVMQ